MDRRRAAALADLASAMELWRVWTTLAWFDVKQKYRRAMIGPFWITLSLLLTTSVLGFIYASLLRVDSSAYLAHISAGLVAWYLIATTLTEGAVTFINAEAFIKQGGLPIALYPLRVVWRNVIVLAHNLGVMLAVYGWTGVLPWRTLLLLPLGVALVIVNLAWIVLVLGPLCTRFRDLGLIVTNLVQIAFFVTPVIFTREHLGAGRHWVADLNPLYYMVEAVRGPLVGSGLQPRIFLTLAVMAGLGWLLAFFFHARARARVAFWI